MKYRWNYTEFTNIIIMAEDKAISVIMSNVIEKEDGKLDGAAGSYSYDEAVELAGTSPVLDQCLSTF